MITFDNDAKQFLVTIETKSYANVGSMIKSISSNTGRALRSSTGKQWAIAGAGINMYRNNRKRNELQARYEAQGKSPEEARKLAKKQTSGMLSSAAKGALVGGAARKVAGGMGLKKTANDIKLDIKDTKLATKDRLRQIKLNQAYKNVVNQSKEQIRNAKRGL